MYGAVSKLVWSDEFTVIQADKVSFMEKHLQVYFISDWWAVLKCVHSSVLVIVSKTPKSCPLNSTSKFSSHITVHKELLTEKKPHKIARLFASTNQSFRLKAQFSKLNIATEDANIEIFSIKILDVLSKVPVQNCSNNTLKHCDCGALLR